MKRSKWKGPYLTKKRKLGTSFLKFNDLFNQTKKEAKITEKFIILSRNCEITSILIGLICKIHSGQTFVKLKITDNMIGHKAGEFIFTRKKFFFKRKKI